MHLSQYLSPEGIYVIEDIQSNYIGKFSDISIFPEYYRDFIQKNFDMISFDTRSTLGRPDDFMLVFKLKK
jgi:hypothetical protein